MSAPRSIGQWLQAIGDCGVLRVSFHDAALHDAVALDLVDVEIVTGDDKALDYRLTARGIFAQAEQVAPQRMVA
ncbi:hypothetical protein [Qipengyuania citrea]|mgnify:CR=1 FL=1|uniref:hypothetical protein n=1 Tax=Qipengyuania citrea TaxID=225971 RepID=UPI0020A0AE86|nr:hypothetical protein [Qipengyuania citrea]MCP2016870.1 hypothetical protein [Qipengyuania citrea]